MTTAIVPALLFFDPSAGEEKKQSVKIKTGSKPEKEKRLFCSTCRHPVTHQMGMEMYVAIRAIDVVFDARSMNASTLANNCVYQSPMHAVEHLSRLQSGWRISRVSEAVLGLGWFGAVEGVSDPTLGSRNGAFLRFAPRPVARPAPRMAHAAGKGIRLKLAVVRKTRAGWVPSGNLHHDQSDWPPALGRWLTSCT